MDLQPASPSIQIAQMLFTFLGTLVSAGSIYLMAKLNNKQDKAQVQREVAAVKVEEVKTTLQNVTAKHEEQMDALKGVADKTHTLVNSNMGSQLKLTQSVSRTLANLTKDPVHEAAAAIADQAVNEHEEQQAKVDAGVKE